MSANEETVWEEKRQKNVATVCAENYVDRWCSTETN